MAAFLQSVDGIVEEIMRIHRSLPTRPGIDEVEAALSLVRNVDQEEQSRLDALSRQKKGFDVPEELFFVLQEMQRSLIVYQSKEQKRDALRLLDLENVHMMFDELVQRASKCIPNSTISASTSTSKAHESSTPTFGSSVGSSAFYLEKVERSSERFSRDDSYVKKSKKAMYADGNGLVSSDATRGLPFVSTTKTLVNSMISGEDGLKLSLIKLASLIEVSAKKGTKDLNLQNTLMDKIEWLPDSIGKLSGLITLDLSENHIIALPATIGGLSSLTKLDLHSNKLQELPEAIGDLFSLVYLNLRANQLTSLPSSISKLSRLAELDLSSNHLTVVSDTIGSLVSLKKLNVETNNIEELPHTIGHCTSLVELHADYNRLKALPEAIGRLEQLEILSVRYNNIKNLPTTMASLSSLKELDASFNELEGVPESLCFATTLLKLNIGNNFADLQYLPRSIGNLEALQELDISNNQIRVLPDSFGMLTQLTVLKAQENPLEVPPRHVAEMGAQAAVQYMIEYVAKRDVKAQPVKNKKTWAQFCFFSRPDKRKHDGVDYVKT
ncbi:hypothetical protein QJS10_CPA10g00077 [Acorus calamus]|uniref:Plant intracellular Ras-group-related LRR protein 4 n=1 Tax=Acorus calamus TaxID=4465 RepID=A0AAV9E256_ACOCL|nr:hypothetical protein QJS10_CPA10g00077 [Acorus calamus]